MEVAMGLVGGIAAEALKWYRIREELYRGIPDYAKSWLYWIVTLVMILLGGLLVFVYQRIEGVELNLLLALNIGASAPLIVGALASQAPPVDPGIID